MMWLSRTILLGLLFIIFAYQNVQAKIRLRKFGPPQNQKPNPRTIQPDWGSIRMPVDHFEPRDARVWSMRYMNNSQHFKPGGPILIFLGGEWEIDEYFLQNGLAFDLAEQIGAYMYYTEHRYYGKSFPTENTSTENLRYHSLDQALEDVAYFIKFIKTWVFELIDSGKVVVVGGSYSATMATWMRLKYPHLVDIAWASSAPLRAVKDFYQYFEVVGKELKAVSDDCYDTISQGILQADSLFATEEGRNELSETFNTCNPVRNEEPYKSSFFYFNIADIFGELVQYAQKDSINTACQAFLGYEGTPMEKLARLTKNSFGDQCIGDYDDLIEYFSNTTNGIETAVNLRLWYYQTCTEFGFFQTATSDNQPFGSTWGVDMFLHLCHDLFGDEFTEATVDAAVKRTNIVYGSENVSVSKLVFVQGSVDPWHTLGVLERDAKDVVAIYVNGSSHGADLGSVSDDDSDELREAKIRILEVIGEWLKE